MTQEVPRLAAVHVISDLHLGGPPGRQIFRLGQRLGLMIDKLAQSTQAGPQALVINGDFVDFLADKDAEYFDGARATAKLGRIVGDDGFKDVFAALQRYVAGAGRRLVIVLGNHDVELALPHVQEWLRSWLSGGDEVRAGRVHFATDGSGWSCEVGDKRVLCIHGNEFDEWNVVDHRALLQYTRAWNRKQDLPEWTPNGGTRLVIDVMNEAKQKNAMVDLLKPETKAAVPMLLAFSPELVNRTGKALRAVSVREYDRFRMAAGFLGSDAVPEDRRPTELEVLVDALAIDEPPARLANSGSGLPPEVYAAQRRIERNEPRPFGHDPSGPTETLGMRDWLDRWSQPTLRRALQRWLAKDKTFDLGYKDDTFRAVDESIGSGVHFVIAGHTHLRRALQRSYSNCFYFNTGTWIRLIELDPSFLDTDAVFAQVVEKLKHRNLADLDKEELGGKPIVKDVPTVASILSTPARVVGKLSNVNEQGDLQTVPGSEFPP